MAFFSRQIQGSWSWSLKCVGRTYFTATLLVSVVFKILWNPHFRCDSRKYLPTKILDMGRSQPCTRVIGHLYNIFSPSSLNSLSETHILAIYGRSWCYGKPMWRQQEQNLGLLFRSSWWDQSLYLLYEPASNSGTISGEPVDNLSWENFYRWIRSVWPSGTSDLTLIKFLTSK